MTTSMIVFRNVNDPETGTCGECGGRTQINVDGQWVHARSGNFTCRKGA
jgi:hypothetical protein